MIWKTFNLLFSFYLNSFQNNTETFGNDAAEITAETKSDLDELIKKTVSKNEMNENYSREKKNKSICFVNSAQNLDFGSDDGSSSGSELLENNDEDDENMFAGQDPKTVFKGMEEEEEEEDLSDDELFEREFTLHKRDYYINKMKYPEMTP